MKLNVLLAASVMAVMAASPAAAAPNACASDAKARAAKLLALHFEDVSTAQLTNASIGDEVKTLTPMKALKGNGKFDVLEVAGYIYKAEYRMRFIYAQIPDNCVLIGQEIIEVVDPY